jgi:predicted DNA-binding transcriptional regulator AlpA
MHKGAQMFDIKNPVQRVSLLTSAVAMARRGRRSSQHHMDINAGTCPPPISIGARGVRFVEHEVAAVIAAEIAGKKREDIKALVAEMVAARPKLLAQIREAA